MNLEKISVNKKETPKNKSESSKVGKFLRGALAGAMLFGSANLAQAETKNTDSAKSPTEITATTTETGGENVKDENINQESKIHIEHSKASYTGLEGDFTTEFDVDSNGNIIQYDQTGYTKVGGDKKLRQLVLVDNWRELVASQYRGNGLEGIHLQEIERFTKDLGIKKLILSTLKKDSAEYKFLKEKIRVEAFLFQKRIQMGDQYKNLFNDDFISSIQ